MSQNESTGQRLRRLRIAKGLSQQQLATKAGLKSQGTIGNIERDTRGYGGSVVAIAKVLGVSPGYLLGLVEHPDGVPRNPLREAQQAEDAARAETVAAIKHWTKQPGPEWPFERSLYDRLMALDAGMRGHIKMVLHQEIEKCEAYAAKSGAA